MKKKVVVNALKPGMYVSELDRPWLESTFLFQGFFINSKKDIEEISHNRCAYVYIDTLKGDDVAPGGATKEVTEHHGAMPAGTVAYQDQAPLEEELEAAREIHQETNELVTNIMEDARLGKKIDAGAAKKAVSGMVDSIVRNPDALVWLTKLKDKDSYTYAHSIDASVLALAFGRHLGFPREELDILGSGAMLMDIGKMRLPERVLSNPGALTETEYKLIRTHVFYSVDLLTKSTGVADAVIEIARQHHERLNGSGYPNGLRGDQIGMFGQICGIIDCYDAITSNKSYRSAISSHQALKMMYQWRNKDFQGALIEQFIESIGIYPLGSLVELSSGDVGVVVTQNRIRRLRPKVMLILDSAKAPYKSTTTIDLMEESIDDAGKPLEIVKVLEADSYGIDPKEFYL